MLQVDERTRRIETIRKCAADGYSMGYAAAELGVTRSTISGLARRNQIKFKCSDAVKSLLDTRDVARPKPVEKHWFRRAKNRNPEQTEKRTKEFRRPLVTVQSKISGATITRKNVAGLVRQRCCWHECGQDPVPGTMTCAEHGRVMKAQGGLFK